MLSRTRDSTNPAGLVPSDNEPQPPPRIELERPLLVLNAEPGQRRTFFGYARNLSAAGMRIDATSPREPGTRYRLEIPLPAPIGVVTRCECEVVWKREYSRGDPMSPGMGLRFLDLPDELTRALDAWIGARRLWHP